MQETMPKRSASHREDEMWLRWQKMAPTVYDRVYYNTNPLVSYINRFGHISVEAPFKANDHFSRVLEVGAGDGQHLPYLKHAYDQYFLTDLHEGHLEVAKKRHESNERVVFERQDALDLEYPDDHFDRLISIYNLEHLPSPHLALKEWRRVVKKGGVISIAIPTEGSLAWNMGRYLTTRRYFSRKGLDLDYIIAREHINACYRLVSLMRYYFRSRKESWFPFGIPLHHINLVYTCTIRNEQ